MKHDPKVFESETTFRTGNWVNELEPLPFLKAGECIIPLEARSTFNFATVYNNVAL